jgi:hypothetical protein
LPIVTDDPVRRKERSEARLRREGVPVNPDLPPIADVASIRVRRIEEIAARAMALCLVAIRGEGLDHETTLQIAEEHGILHHLTIPERTFLLDPQPMIAERHRFTWRYECYHLLLWALSYIDDPGRPDDICEVRTAVEVLVERGAERFLFDARLRAATELLDHADLLSRYQWALREAGARNEEPPTGLNPSVIAEWQRTFRWLLHEVEQWED